MSLGSPTSLPYPQMIARKHDFGNGRYVTLMVSNLPNRTKGSLFGTELQPQIEFTCEGVEDGCLIADALNLNKFSPTIRAAQVA